MQSIEMVEIQMTNLVEFVHNSLEGDRAPTFVESSVFQNARDVVASISHFTTSNAPRDEWIETRVEVAKFSREYTKKLETIVRTSDLLNEVWQKIETLESCSPAESQILMSAHQPNLFAYSGVMKKIALLQHLSNELAIQSETDSGKSVCFFGFADHDFVHNKWVRSAEIDSPARKDGVLRFNVKIDKKDIYLPSNRIAPPSESILEDWKKQILNWIAENSSIARNFVKAQKLQLSADMLKIAIQNFDEFWDLVRRVHASSKNLAEFNSLLLASVVLEFWRLPVVFANFSDCFTLFPAQYKWFIENHEATRAIIEESETGLRSFGVDSGLSDDYGEISPVWMKCNCGSKYKFDMTKDMAYGKCLRCSKEITWTNSELATAAFEGPESFEPRSIFMPIAFSQSLGVACYVGGIGGLGYLLHSRAVAEKFDIQFPPTPFWYSKDEYLTIQRLAIAQELERIKQSYSIFIDISEKESAPKAMYEHMKRASADLKIPRSSTRERDLQILGRVDAKETNNSCMIDYAVNISLQKVCKQWVEFLETDGRLLVPVHLSSAFEA